MRLLHVIASCSSGGAEVFVRDLCVELKVQGHDCAIAYLSSCEDLGANTDFEREYLASLDSAGVGHFEVGHRSRTNPLLGAARLRRAIRSFRPAIVHLHLVRAVLIRSLCALRVPTVFTWHNTVFTFHPSAFVLINQVVDRYIAICSLSQKLLSERTTKGITKIYNGIPASRIHFAGVRRPAGPLNIISVGNLTRQKNYCRLIRVAARVRDALGAEDNCPKFTIIGQGSEDSRLRDLIRQNRLDEHVVLLGMRSDIDDLMSGSDAYLLTSDYEGFPIALLEAMRSGLPIIASDVGGVNEIVRPGENGYLISPDDEDAFVARLVELSADRQLLTQMSAGASKRIGEFLIDESARRHVAVYASLLS